jgi:signal transduction histidine kinase
MSSTEPDRLPADTEARLSDFTELLGLAIANTESREALERLADEQAALRQVATLVGQGLPPDDIFSAVIEEVAGLFGCGAGIMRFEHDPPGFVYVAVPKALDTPLRLRGNIESETAPAAVYRTGRPARRERQDWSSDGPLAATARHRGIVSAVANPIIVDNRLWGAMNLWSSDEPLPPNTEERLERFTALLVTAIANAESREALRLLAEEQAALRRVATLVAQGVPASKVFMAVTDEVAELFGEGLATIGRFDVDQPTITIVGIGTNVDWIEIGTRVALTDETPTGRVYATDRPARVDRADWSTAESPQGRIAHQMAIVSAVASPIIVEGRPWGAMSAMATTRPLPPDTETRLERFSELVAAAIANTESRTELAASRRRIVAASDDARRRIERNLHDGTQQRLVSLGLAVKAAQADVPLDLRNVRSELSKIAKELADAAAELQEISRGIHPVLLSQSGIGAALRMLGRRSPIPVTIDLAVDSRLPEPVEVAAYYVASEALANAAKHARATHISVSLTPRDEGVLLSIIDDGIGGADPTQGSGLVGLIDRVEALGGSIDIRSAPGGGTRITSELPLDPGSGAPLE